MYVAFRKVAGDFGLGLAWTTPRFKSNNSSVWYQRGCLQRFIGSAVELMQMQCRMCSDVTAAEAEDLMRSEDRHIKSITVCMSANCVSSLTYLAFQASVPLCRIPNIMLL